MTARRIGVAAFVASAISLPVGPAAATVRLHAADSSARVVARVIRFAPAVHSATWVARQPGMTRAAKGVEVTISSPRSLRRGPVRYEGGYKQQKLAAAVFLYNTNRDLFRAGLALHAGGGVGCKVHTHEDLCRTLVVRGFIEYRGHHWKRLKITLFKPARQAATVRVILRPE